ncbi:MAG: hypothetical protein IT209_10955 [Armatimonadetes bacterium]|nr:hypothetical protein [Armatimonadota bacterium]
MSAVFLYPVIGTCLFIVALAVLRWWGKRVTNFQGRTVPTGLGAYILAWAAPAALLVSWGTGSQRFEIAWVVALVPLGVLGFLDDILGSHGGGGFSGHFRSALRGRITTGFLKAVIGGVGTLAGAYLLETGRESAGSALYLLILCDALVIALSANFINLLDLRPGRAGWVFLALWYVEGVAIWLFGWGGVAWMLLSFPAVIVLVALLPWDMRAIIIQGDAGSNTLGAILGLGCAAFLPVWLRAVALVLLVAVHIFAEKSSISSAITASPFLAALDKRLGVR